MTSRAFTLSFVAALALASATLAPRVAHACYDDDDGRNCGEDRQAEQNYDEDKPIVGVGMDVMRLTPGLDSIASPRAEFYALKTSMHARLGKRVAIAVGMEEGYGTDGSGFKRYDLGWSLPDVYIYLTPRSSLQLYSVMGFDMRVSHFESGDVDLPKNLPWGNFYMGASMGWGIETRWSKGTAFRLELRGFVRGRVDDTTTKTTIESKPEFADATRTTKGAMLTLGLIMF
jgi:hypothetical protein